MNRATDLDITPEEEQLARALIEEIGNYALDHSKEEYFAWIGTYLVGRLQPDQRLVALTALINVTANFATMIDHLSEVMTEEQMEQFERNVLQGR